MTCEKVRVLAVLDTMHDPWADGEDAPRHFRINPDNLSGRRLWQIIGAHANLLVTNACRQHVKTADEHGTPDPEWLAQNIRDAEPFDVLLMCGKVAQEAYARCGYHPNGTRVFEIPHPAARNWTREKVAEVARLVQGGT